MSAHTWNVWEATFALSMLALVVLGIAACALVAYDNHRAKRDAFLSHRQINRFAPGCFRVGGPGIK